ncbi:MAG: DNA primase [Chlamydiae bacterium GWC2_50_10]|nr:MAG: DNA primase [Chlamydiae bacterium GWA2_50_15]OGN54050.1 MAG: DNA primase [Chlamydiae bacterium GWF2_49_8]OGN54625.1 MAG: DNA primase [Chlamydiae bacterium GWC2_50_10]OGN58827.1 MAG: DNA primase [Chlamydiae bacterium RIFCSPHIGHO2_02_FULL_49_29]OGN70520.1 MAG: DNA primase [Chlamydiae bacterium RIFCSPLOWO2_02_FULL_49_12]OGN74785.1 MAG: DNA primase [Chlamydiae bacterium RIFCSPLOWO2_12_FULL_49_12]HAZ15093.1 DNA primase [Parachlamydiales bacterium]
MDVFKKESLELLRSRIDLVEVLSPHLALKNSGSVFKALCPFHEEKTPSFIIKRGDSHYHCFGCGAHGDAIAFLMGYLKMNFLEAVEHLAERFQVALERESSHKGDLSIQKAPLKEALEKAASFFHFCLLHTKEGHEALSYLYKRGISLDFIRSFRLGWAPSQGNLLLRFLKKERVSEESAQRAGLIRVSERGFARDFFSERITFPILDKLGAVIGFSARKIKESTFGGKYINTPDTLLFKKSHVLFGLYHSRKRIAKEQRAIVVEGQIDALRLIHEGFDFVVAAQGTAFGEGHLGELLSLGVRHVYLALDADRAGEAAMVKIGNLFQKLGIEVSILDLPKGSDPDTLLQEAGPEGFLKLLEKRESYLSFLIKTTSREFDLDSPSGKSHLVRRLSEQIRSWDEPVMVHESLRLLSQLLHIPERMIGVDELVVPNLYVKREENLSSQPFNADKVMESDLVRWLLLSGTNHPQIALRARRNLKKEDFRDPICKKLFDLYFALFDEEKPRDLLAITIQMKEEEEGRFLSELLEKRVSLERVDAGVTEAIQKLLIRNWMEEREELKAKLQDPTLSEEKALFFVKKFDELKKSPPQVLIESKDLVTKTTSKPNF